MDWSGCDLVEVVEGKVSGVSLVKDTRIPADFLLEDLQRGAKLKEIAETFPSIPEETLRGMLTYAVERSAWDQKTLVYWKGCALVEPEEIVEDFPSLSVDTVAELIRYVKVKEAQAASKSLHELSAFECGYICGG